MKKKEEWRMKMKRRGKRRARWTRRWGGKLREGGGIWRGR
jgi:hypothetical protein